MSYCIEEDRSEIGETYWHRIHQLAGVLICPKHKCFLQDSSAIWGRGSASFFHLAEEFVKPEKPEYVDNTKPEHHALLFLAENAQWLLNQKYLSLPSGELRERYYNILLEREYAYYNGKVKISKLYKNFIDLYSQHLLEELGCQIKSTNRNWLSRMTEKVLANVFYHPVRHLLLLNSLGVSAKEFFTLFAEFKPFCEPPYPCLNKIASHYGELRIKTCQIFDNLTKDKKFRGPIAVFNCSCGFIYQRLGPDKSDEDKFRFDSVKQYGDIWEDALAQHWATLNISLTEVAQKFGTTPHLITRHAIRLGLPRNSENTRSSQGYANHFNPRMSFSQNLDKYRNSFLELRKKNPKANRTTLMTKANFTLQWLYRNDKKWLEAHLPKHGRVYRKLDHLNWRKIDKDISKQVKSTVHKIRQFPRKPIRISITEIIRRIGQKGWIERRKEKLPLTTKAITESLETLEDFMIRKLLWAENKFLRKKTVPTKNQIIRIATINNSTTQNSTKIQNEIEASLARLQNSIYFR